MSAREASTLYPGMTDQIFPWIFCDGKDALSFGVQCIVAGAVGTLRLQGSIDPSAVAPDPATVVEIGVITLGIYGGWPDITDIGCAVVVVARPMRWMRGLYTATSGGAPNQFRVMWSTTP